MAREKQQKVWKKRIRTIQALCILIIVSFGTSDPPLVLASRRPRIDDFPPLVNRNVAIAGIAYLIYTTFSSEIENMLKPPDDMTEIHETIQKLTQRSASNEVGPIFSLFRVS